MSKIVGAVIPVLCCLFVGPNPGARMMKVVSANYPASVIQNHLQAVYDLREPGAVGPRSSITKVLGRTPFPANCGRFENGIVAITSSCTLSNWDFTGATIAFSVEGSSTVVTIQDSLFSLTCGSKTPIYGIEISDTETMPIVHLSHDKFQGNRCNDNDAWSAAYYVRAGASLVIDHSLLLDLPFDVGKCTNSSLTMTSNYIRAYGWNANADADALQSISCVADIDGNFFDISDGAPLSLAHNFPGTPANSAIFDTLDVPSTQNGALRLTNNIFYGYGLYGRTCCSNTNSAANGLPFNVILGCNNHTVLDSVFTLSETIENNVIQKGNQGYYVSGGNLRSTACIASWARNVDYDTSRIIPEPRF